ncbi:hypothetical protein T484DRAFT_2220549 [Baffinella frigidus]|nr:hypothetical protein T484DRAFT_2220549 [Cryptophyta sp. CCMP2293]
MSAKLAKKKMRELFADPGKPVAAGETKAASGPKRSAKRRRLKAFPQTFTARPAPDAKAKRLRANVERKVGPSRCSPGESPAEALSRRSWTQEGGSATRDR